MRNTQGFIGTLTVIVVGICIIFLVLAVAAQRLPAAVGGEGKGTFLGGAKDFVGYDYDSKANPLVDFLGSDGVDRGVSGGDQPNGSYYTGKVTLDTSGVYSAQPFEEYVAIRNGGLTAVDITGWKLTNGKGTRPIENSNNDYFYPTPDTVTVGQGAEFLDPDGNFRVGNIILKPGDTAILTTGGPFTQYSYSIPVSFRENICIGYLDTHPFTPSLSRQCPAITSDPGIRAMTDECYDYAASLGRCVDPTKGSRKQYFDEQTSICRNFISIRSNYSGCVRDHKNDANFYSKQWRVFLSKKQELWASSREVITLYDKNGNVVDRKSY